MQILAVLPLLWIQAALLNRAVDSSTLSSVLRAFLILPISYVSNTAPFHHQFAPETSRIVNCVVGVAGVYASWKGLEFGLVRNPAAYEWVGFGEEKKDQDAATPSKPLHATRHSPLHLLTSMRGLGYRFGPKNYPPRQTIRHFLVANSIRLVLTHALSLVCGVILSTPRHNIARVVSEQLATSTAVSQSLASFVHSLALGSEAYAALSLGFATVSLLALLLVSIAHRLFPNRFAAFDSREYTPIIDSPWAISSVTVFWKSRWHSLFRRSFVFLGFPFGGRSALANVVGTMNVFLLSSILHQQGELAIDQVRYPRTDFPSVAAIYSALSQLPPKHPPLSLTVEHGGSIYFLSQGAAILFEAAFAKIVGRKIESFRILGLLFGYSVVAGMGGYLAESWYVLTRRRSKLD